MVLITATASAAVLFEEMLANTVTPAVHQVGGTRRVTSLLAPEHETETDVLECWGGWAKYRARLLWSAVGQH